MASLGLAAPAHVDQLRIAEEAEYEGLRPVSFGPGTASFDLGGFTGLVACEGPVRFADFDASPRPYLLGPEEFGSGLSTLVVESTTAGDLLAVQVVPDPPPCPGS